MVQRLLDVNLKRYLAWGKHLLHGKKAVIPNVKKTAGKSQVSLKIPKKRVKIKIG